LRPWHETPQPASCGEKRPDEDVKPTVTEKRQQEVGDVERLTGLAMLVE
jgi:hypothetical protein